MNDLNIASFTTFTNFTSSDTAFVSRFKIYILKKKKKIVHILRNICFQRREQRNFGVFSLAFSALWKTSKSALYNVARDRESMEEGEVVRGGKKPETMKRASVNFYARRFYFQVMCNPFNSSRIYGDTRDVRENDWITLLHH